MARKKLEPGELSALALINLVIPEHSSDFRSGLSKAQQYSDLDPQNIDIKEPYEFIKQKLIDISEDDSEFERKAEITLKDHGEIRTIVGYGNGPIDAVKDAFNENGFVYTHFLDYSEHSLSSGSSSKAAAYVYLRVKGSAVQEYGVGVPAKDS